MSSRCVVCRRSTSLRCSQCHSTPYCSVECQKRDWPEHYRTHLLIEAKRSRDGPIPEPGVKKRRIKLGGTEMEITEFNDRITTDVGISVPGSCGIRVLFVYFPVRLREKGARVLLFKNRKGGWKSIGGGMDGTGMHNSKSDFPLEVVVGKHNYRGIFDPLIREFVRAKFAEELPNYAANNSPTFHRLAVITGVSRTFIDNYQILNLIVRVDRIEKNKIPSDNAEWFSVDDILERKIAAELGLKNTLLQVFRYDEMESIFPKFKNVEHSFPKDFVFYDEHPWHLYMNGPALFTADELDEMLNEVAHGDAARPRVMKMNSALDAMIQGPLSKYYDGFDETLIGDEKWYFHGCPDGGLVGNYPTTRLNFLTPYCEMAHGFSDSGSIYAYTFTGIDVDVVFQMKSYNHKGFEELRRLLFGEPGAVRGKLGVIETPTFKKIARNYIWPISTSTDMIHSAFQPRDMSDRKTYGPANWLQLYAKVVGVVSKGRPEETEEPQIILPRPVEDYFLVRYFKSHDSFEWEPAEYGLKHTLRHVLNVADVDWISRWLSESPTLVPFTAALQVTKDEAYDWIRTEWKESWFDNKPDNEFLDFLELYSSKRRVSESLLKYAYEKKGLRVRRNGVFVSFALLWYEYQSTVVDFVASSDSEKFVGFVTWFRTWEAAHAMLQKKKIVLSESHAERILNACLKEVGEWTRGKMDLSLYCLEILKKREFSYDELKDCPEFRAKAIEMGRVQDLPNEYLEELWKQKQLYILSNSSIALRVSVVVFLMMQSAWNDVRDYLKSNSSIILPLFEKQDIQIVLELLKHGIVPSDGDALNAKLLERLVSNHRVLLGDFENILDEHSEMFSQYDKDDTLLRLLDQKGSREKLEVLQNKLSLRTNYMCRAKWNWDTVNHEKTPFLKLILAIENGKWDVAESVLEEEDFREVRSIPNSLFPPVLLTLSKFKKQSLLEKIFRRNIEMRLIFPRDLKISNLMYVVEHVDRIVIELFHFEDIVTELTAEQLRLCLKKKCEMTTVLQFFTKEGFMHLIAFPEKLKIIVGYEFNYNEGIQKKIIQFILLQKSIPIYDCMNSTNVHLFLELCVAYKDWYGIVSILTKITIPHDNSSWVLELFEKTVKIDDRSMSTSIIEDIIGRILQQNLCDHETIARVSVGVYFLPCVLKNLRPGVRYTGSVKWDQRTVVSILKWTEILDVARKYIEEWDNNIRGLFFPLEIVVFNPNLLDAFLSLDSEALGDLLDCDFGWKPVHSVLEKLVDGDDSALFQKTIQLLGEFDDKRLKNLPVVFLEKILEHAEFEKVIENDERVRFSSDHSVSNIPDKWKHRIDFSWV